MRRSIAWLLVMLGLSSTLRAGEVVIHPRPAPGPLDNPLKGWCPYADAGTIRQPYSMVFLSTSWKALEPARGVYAFDQWERREWSAPAAAGRHVVFRVYVDYPSKPSGLPDWLAKLGVKQTRYEDHGGGLATDFDDPRVVEGLERLIAALGRRYDGDPRVGFVQLGLLGFWGEWHTFPRVELHAKPATRRRVVDAYRRAFPRKLLMARYADAVTGAAGELGYHDDMFPADTDNGLDWSFLAGLRREGRSENWRRAAVGGELEPFRAAHWLGDGWATTLSAVEKGHFSWIGPYGPALDRSTDPAFRKNSEALVRRLGYQFRLDEVRVNAPPAPGQELQVSIQGTNEGVAPFSYDWPVEIALLGPDDRPLARRRLDLNLRNWHPGPFSAAGRIAAAAPRDCDRLAVGVIDPRTGRPGVRFANDLVTVDGWTILLDRKPPSAP